MYSPAASTNAASNSRLLDSLNVSARHGRNSRAREILATAALPTPWRRASDRVDHATDPSSGTLRRVSDTIAYTTLDGPGSKHRSRQHRTEF